MKKLSLVFVFIVSLLSMSVVAAEESEKTNATQELKKPHAVFMTTSESGRLSIEKAHIAYGNAVGALLNMDIVSFQDLKAMLQEVKTVDLKNQDVALKIAKKYQLDYFVLNVEKPLKRAPDTFIYSYTAYVIDANNQASDKFDYVVRYTKADYENGKRKGLTEFQTFGPLLAAEFAKNFKKTI